MASMVLNLSNPDSDGHGINETPGKIFSAFISKVQQRLVGKKLRSDARAVE